FLQLPHPHPASANPAPPSLNFIGRTERRKGPDIFVDLVSWLPRSAYSAANIIGPDDRAGSNQFLQAMIRNRNVDIRLLGSWNPAQLASLFASRAITLLPSRYDTLNLLVLESLFSGCPVIVGDGAGVIRFLRDELPHLPILALDVTHPRASLGPIRHLLENYDAARENLLRALERGLPKPTGANLAEIYASAPSPDLRLTAHHDHTYAQLLRLHQDPGPPSVLLPKHAPPARQVTPRDTELLQEADRLATAAAHDAPPKVLDAARRARKLWELYPSILFHAESTEEEIVQKLSTLWEGARISPADRLRWWREIARLERIRSNDLLAATYALRSLRLLGQDRFFELPFILETLATHGYTHEAEAARALFGPSRERDRRAAALLAEARTRHRHNPNRPFDFIDDRRHSPAPRVSIVVSLYDAASKLPHFLNLLRDQTMLAHGAAELVLVETGSPSDDYRVFQQWLQLQPWEVVYARTHSRETIQSAWNRGIALARAPYLAFLGVDETLLHHALETLAQELDQDPNLDWVISNSLVTEVNSHGAWVRDVMLYNRADYHQDLAYLETCYLSWVGGLYRRSIHDRFGYYDPTFHAAGDTEFKNRVLPFIRSKAIPGTLGYFLNYPDARTTQSPRAELEDLRAWYLHRSPAGIAYAFDQRSLTHAEALFARALSYRKSYLQHTSTDLEYAAALAAYVLARQPDSRLARFLPGVQRLRQAYQALELTPSLSQHVLSTQILKTWRSARDLAREHTALGHPGGPPAYEVFNDNRYEQHTEVWKSELRAFPNLVHGRFTRRYHWGPAPEHAPAPPLPNNPQALTLPRITILTPSLNCAPYLRQCLESVASQNYPNLEHIVIDGGSQDGTLEILQQFPNVRWVSGPDRGEAHALNKALRLASGDLLCWLNADDWLEPGVLDHVAREFNPDRGRHILYGHAHMVDESGKALYLKRTYPVIDLNFLLRWWQCPAHPHQPAMFFSREVIDTIGGFNESLHYSIDLDFWLRAVRSFPFYHLNRPLANARVRVNSKSINTEGDQIQSHWALTLPHHELLNPDEQVQFWKDYFHHRLFERKDPETTRLADHRYAAEGLLAALAKVPSLPQALTYLFPSPAEQTRLANLLQTLPANSLEPSTRERLAQLVRCLATQADPFAKPSPAVATPVRPTQPPQAPVPSNGSNRADPGGNGNGKYHLANASPNPQGNGHPNGALAQALAQADQLYAAGQLDAALAQLEQAASLAPDQRELLTALGSLQFNTGRHPDSVQTFQRLVALHPDDPELQTQLALAAFHAQQAELFEAALSRALELAPGYEPALRLLARINFEHERFIQAGRLYAKLIEHHPKDIELLLCFALCCRGGGDDRAASKVLATVLELDPTHLGALRLQAAIQLAQDLPLDAAQSYGRLIQHAPDDLEAILGLGACLFYQDEFAHAAEMFREAVRLAPDHPQAKDCLRACEAKLADTNPAPQPEPPNPNPTPAPAPAPAPAHTATNPTPTPTQPALPVPVRWLAPFFNPSGYASEAINFVLPLARHLTLGIHHHTRLYSEQFVADLPPAERQQLFALRDRFPSLQGGIVVSHNLAPGFARLDDATYHIGRTMFETDRLPLAWVKRCNQMDEVWVPSHFNLESFAASGVERHKLVVIPEAVDDALFDPARHSPLPLPNRAACNFLALFEWTLRKGWDVLLAAYLREFSADDDVCLYLRTYLINDPDGSPADAIQQLIREHAAKLGLANKPLPRIHVLPHQIPLADLPRLYLAADCLVAPSRGEGWGRPQHEAMMMARPIIATNWSGTTEFINPDIAYPIDFELADIKHVEPEHWHYHGHRWANPSENHLRQLLRHVQQNPAEARARGQAARAHMLQHFSREPVAAQVLARLYAVAQRLTTPTLPAVSAHPLEVNPELPHQQLQAINVAWEGSFLDYGSLSHVNRQLTQHLARVPRLNLTCVGKNVLPPTAQHPRELKSCARRLRLQAPASTQVTVRHAWPPQWERPTHGAWVLIQPWEFGALPAEWVDQAQAVDEIWAYSDYVRRVYVDSGIDPAKVKVVPLGIDPDRFHPDVAPIALPTQKSYRFLFVGGTIRRKGPDLLLQAYLETFTDADDVCLVIKDFGGQSVYQGQTIEAQIRAAQNQPHAPEILYLNDELPPEALPSLYTACHCLVHPYRGEGFALPVLEAMACGLPVTAPGGGATDDFATDEYAYRLPALRRPIGPELSGQKLIYSGWLLEPSTAELARVIRSVLLHRREAAAKGRAASQFVRAHWTWHRSAAIAAQRLQNLVARHQSAAASLAQRRARKAKPIAPPQAARVGHLAEARQRLCQNRLLDSWQLTLAALERRPFHPEAWLLLADIALQANDPQRARDCAQQALALAPQWPPAARLLKQLPTHPTAKSPAVALPPLPSRLPTHPSNPRLTVLIIARNEERFIAACLRSVQNLADQVVLVDTGSTDRTAEIARQSGAEVYAHPWNDDFSAARNAGLERARGDWILVLDADEELAPDNAAALRTDLSQPHVIALRLPMIDVGRENEGRSTVPRLFRNAPGLFYVGRIHEQVFSSLLVRAQEWGLQIELGKTELRHHGYTVELVRSRQKIARNLRLLTDAIDEFPNEPNLLMNLGLELARAGHLEAGLEQYFEAFAILSAQPAAQLVPELREALLTQLGARLVNAHQYPQAVAVLTSPLAQRGGLTATTHWLLGLAYTELKRHAEAADQFRACLATRAQPGLTPILKEIHTGAPHHCLALCLAQLNQPDLVRQSFEAALAESPQAQAIALDFARFQAEHGQPVDALKRLHHLVSQNSDDPKTWLLGGHIALSRPEFLEVACDWTAEAVRCLPAHPAIAQQRAEALLLSGDPAASLALWQSLPVTDPPAHVAALILCQLALGRHPKPLPRAHDPLVSPRFLAWYQRLARFGAIPVLEQLNARRNDLAALLPTAASALANGNPTPGSHLHPQLR
ncbi:MAG: glycosyltransferase, partial [Verrucomicrobia bacterium]|nr:glycosyltransferase [Verrucomicrobiota bacterium]